MTESQKIQIKLSQTREAANDPTTTDADRERLPYRRSSGQTYRRVGPWKL